MDRKESVGKINDQATEILKVSEQKKQLKGK
jgi:hypothetical protein